MKHQVFAAVLAALLASHTVCAQAGNGRGAREDGVLAAWAGLLPSRLQTLASDGQPPAMGHEPGRPGREDRRLRNLRLKEAVQEGDLSPAEARRAMQGRPRPHAGGDWPGAAPEAPPPGKRNFWRDRRQKFQQQND